MATIEDYTIVFAYIGFIINIVMACGSMLTYVLKPSDLPFHIGILHALVAIAFAIVLLAATEAKDEGDA